MREFIFREETYRGCKIKIVADPDPENPREWGSISKFWSWHRRCNLGDKDAPNKEGFWVTVRDAVRQEGEPRLEQVADDLDHIEFCAQSTDDYRERVPKLRQELERDLAFSAGDVDDSTFCERARQELSRWQDAYRARAVILPVYLYDHSGLALSTSPFSCSWDSGQVGWIWASIARYKSEWLSSGTEHSEDELREKLTELLKGEIETYNAYLQGEVAGYVAEDPEGEEIDSCWGYYPEGNNYAYAMEEARSAVDYWVEQDLRLRTEEMVGLI